MNYNTLNDNTYSQYRLAFIAQVEGIKSLPYYDTAGIPTIGIGFNLRVDEVLRQVVEAFGFNLNSAADQNYYAQIQAAVAGNAGSNAALQAELNGIMQARATAEGGGRTTFAFSAGAAGLQEIQGAFDLVVQAQENALTNFYGAIPNSTERLALLSLKYSGVLGRNVRAALNGGDRAEAWYEIQYGSNLDGQHAKRRYEEAALFGLFDARGQATLDGASDAYRMLALNRTSISRYDNRNGVLVGEANADLAATQIPAVVAQTAQVAFAPAAAEIIGQLARQYGSLSSLSPDFYNPLDIYLNPGRGAAVRNGAPVALDLAYAARLDASATTSDVILVASEGGASSLDPDLGNDALIAGSGDDVLIAGKGNDTLTGGRGNDTIIAGAGTALIRVGTGNNLLDFEFGQNGAPGLAIEKVVDPYGAGSIIINGARIGGALSNDPSRKDTWTDLAGNTYQFFSSNSDRAKSDAAGTGFGALGAYAPYIGELVVTPGLGSASSAGAVELFGFNLEAAENNPRGFLGIVLPKKLSITAGSNAGFDPPPPSFQAGGSQSYTVWLDAPAATAQTITVTLSGVSPDNFELDTGNDIEALSAAGTFTVTIDAGQTSASFTLTNTADAGDDGMSLQLIATVADPTDPNASSVSSDPLTQDYAEPTSDNPFAQPGTTQLYQFQQTTTADGLAYTAYTNLSSSAPVGAVGNGNNYILIDGAIDESIAGGAGNDTIDASFGNVTTGGALVDGGVDVITGNGGNDFILVGSPSVSPTSPAAHSDVRIYAGSQVDLATAIENANSGDATGGQGDLIVSNVANATIVGSNGNDLIIDAGDDIVVAGPGDDTILSGVHGSDNDVTQFGGWTGMYPTPGQTWSASTDSDNGVTLSDNLDSWGYWDPISPGPDYEGMVDLYGSPFLATNSTIYGGSGNDLIGLSNGNNYVELGSGNATVMGSMGSNTIIGGGGSNYIIGGGGSDYIDLGDGTGIAVGRGGNNTIFGGAGNDTIYAGSQNFPNYQGEERGDNYVQAGSGNTLIDGSGGNDTLLGGSGNNTIQAGAGNEYIVGGTGNESINGGPGNDTLIAGGDGLDTIWAGDGNATIYGGGGSDEIHGGSGTNLIYAGEGGTAAAATSVMAGSGAATIYGGDGVDYIEGGAGDDVIYAGDGGTANGATTIVAGSGNTTIYGGAGVDQIFGGSGTNVLYAGDGGTDSNPTFVIAGTGMSSLYGGAGASALQDNVGGSDLLEAGSGDSTLMGIGNDTLIAGGGIDLLSGSGNVTYRFDAGNGEAQVDNVPGSGTLEFSSDEDAADMLVSAGLYTNGNTYLQLSDGDWSVSINGGLAGTAVASVEFDGSASMSLLAQDASGSASLSLAELVQAAAAAGNTFDTTVAGAIGNLIFDTANGDSITGGIGHDTISSWGNDAVITAGTSGSTIFTAGDHASVVGGTGNDTLEASGDNSTLVGGFGDETFAVDTVTTVVEAQYGAASNTLFASVSYTLPENVDVMTLTGTADLVAYGNDDDTNVITANSGNDTLYAGSGEDTLISGTGVDVLAGGSGDDVFVVNNSADEISLPFFHGEDTVFSSVSYTLTAQISYLTLTGSDNLAAADGFGYATLTGNAGNDTLIGGSGADTLVAGTGIDTLVTGTGNNLLVINNVADVIEVSAGTGSDTVQSSVSYTLQQSLDTLTLTGTADVVGQGNDDLHNLITGNAGHDTLIAGSGNDTLVAGTGIDTLISGSGIDLLEGRGGDTFVLSGSGSAEVQLSQGSGTVQFGTGVAAADLNFSFVFGSDAAPALLINGDGISVTIDGGLQGSISQFDFADGSHLTLAQLLSAGHVQNTTVPIGSGNLVLNGTQGALLQGGTGSDTLIGTGAGDTIMAGSGHQALYGYGIGDVLVGGVGDDTLYGSGNDTLAAGSGDTTLFGGGGRNTYLLTQGGTATLDISNVSSGVQWIYLPPGMTAADFSAQISPNGDLVLQSTSGDTLAIIQGFYSGANANTPWILSDQSGNSQLLRDWVSTASQGSTGGGPGVSAYEAEVQALLKEYQAELGITLHEMGIKGATMERPNSTTNADSYTFTGVGTQNLAVQGGSLQIGASASDEEQFVETSENTYTKQYFEPVYTTYTIPGSATFIPETSSEAGGITVDLGGDESTSPPLIVNGQLGFIYATGPRTITVQTGTRLVTSTYTVQDGYTKETQGFSIYNITGDGGSDTITAAAPFLGTVVTGDGNNVNVDLGIDDWNYWGSVNWGGHLTFDKGDTLAPGAFIDVGDGINDTIEGTGNPDIIAAGSGFDYILASLGSTIYVPMEGTSTEIIATGNAPYYGNGPFPKNTLVLPEGVTLQNLQVKAIYNPVISFPNLYFDPGSATGSFLQLTYGDSTVLLAYGDQGPSHYLQNADSDDTDGINRVQFANGTVLTRSQLLAMAGSVIEVDNTYNPVITQLTQSVVANTMISAADLFAGSDAGSSIRLYQISNSASSGAGFSLNGTVYSPGQEFQIAADQLSQLQYIPGAADSTDTLTVTAFDGFTLGETFNLSLSITGDSGPSVFQATDVDQTVLGLPIGPVTLIGGYAGDTLVGASAVDTFEYSVGGGAETVTETAATTGTSANVLHFGGGITPAQISLSVAAGGALLATLGTNGDSVTLVGFNPTNPLTSMPIQQFQFADGTSLSFQQLLNQVAASSGEVTNPDGSITYYNFTPGQDELYEGQTYAAGSQAGQQFMINADGTIREYTLDADGRRVSAASTYTNGTTSHSTYSYNADGSYTQSEVDTPADGSGATTSVLYFDSAGNETDEDVINPDGSTEHTTFDAQGRWLERDVTHPDGSTDNLSFNYQPDGSSIRTEIQTDAGGARTTFVISSNAQGQATTQNETDSNGTTYDTTYSYNPDGSSVGTTLITPADGGPSTTEVSDYDSSGDRLSRNGYTAVSGSYLDTWDKSDGSSGSYWWNASTLEYQASWYNSDGSNSTDDYQYATGGSPGGSGVSFTETYSDSAGDHGTRQYDATTGVTSLTWYSDITGTLTGTTTDSGFVGLQNDGELTNTQHDPSFFNPAVSPSFQSFLAGH